MNAQIHIEDFELPCRVGIYDHEKRGLQTLFLSLTVTLDIFKAAKSDSIHDTVDYDHLIVTILHVAAQKHYNLIETLAYELSETLFNQFPILKNLSLCLKKTQAIEKAKWSAITLEIKR